MEKQIKKETFRECLELLEYLKAEAQEEINLYQNNRLYYNGKITGFASAICHIRIMAQKQGINI